MTATTRNSPVEKNVKFIDFRCQLSAFDKYFYFGDPNSEKKQDYLRRRSKYVKRAFDNENPSFPGKNSRITSQYALNHRIELDKNEIKLSQLFYFIKIL